MSLSSDALSMEVLDEQFETVMQSIGSLDLSHKEVYKAFAPIRWHLFRCKWIKRAKLTALVAALALSVYYIPLLNWNASAVGRLVMIQVLPYWNWVPLYKERCLIGKINGFSAEQGTLGTKIPIPVDDCAVCENYESVPRLRAISFDFLNEHFFLRNLPVVIEDSHDRWKNRSWKSFSSFVEGIEPLVLARPCNLQTNLIFGTLLSKKADNALANLNDMLTHMHRNGSWFLHFRNCELKTVKQTRLLFEKPYFYPPHLEMPYTTWLLMSNNYRTKFPKSLKMHGWIVIMQLKEMLRVILNAKANCENICSELVVDLYEGESLLFSTKLWTMDYMLPGSNETTISFITETYLN